MPLQSNESLIRGNQTLLIPEATSVNNGYYSCRVDIGKTHATSDKVFVRVIGVPGVPVISTKRCVVVTQSDNVTLHCNISVNPAALFVYWTKRMNGKEYVIDADGGNLQDPNLKLISVNLNDTGMYTCHAGNLVGNSSGNPIKMSVISASRNMIEGVAGHPVGFLNITTYCSQVNYILIRCHKTTGEIIYLDMLDVFFPDNMETHTYGKHVSYLNYTGTYNCTADDDDGITTGSEFDVIIYGVILTIEPALTFDVSPGEEIQIKCYVQAVPELTGFSWIHNNKSLQSDGGLTNGSHTLIIPVATSVNNGQYRCSAENAKTSATSDPVNVNIIGGLPVISTNGQTHVVVHQSETVTLPCNIDSKPAALFAYWTKQVKDKEYVFDANGGNLHEPSLNFLEAKWTDTGTYICHAGNSLGNSSGSAIYLFVISGT
ncbi:cell adhesion molecule CEACAM5-like [Mytilus edulis]|uniref:cell adhesion molecule CEACAM5-like n=1 Tax=Mytilus edulis TaxID=6550 RepID=UPI0039EE81AC